MNIKITALSAADYFGRGEITFDVDGREVIMKTLPYIAGYELTERSQMLNDAIMQIVNFDLESEEEMSDDARLDAANYFFEESFDENDECSVYFRFAIMAESMTLMELLDSYCND